MADVWDDYLRGTPGLESAEGMDPRFQTMFRGTPPPGYGTPPPAPPPAAPAPSVGPPSADQSPERRRADVSQHVTNTYREYLGRDPVGNELETDIANYERYGGDRLRSNLQQRAGSNGGGGGGASGPGFQFDDAYSRQLERIAQGQMGEVRSNPGLDALMKFLTQQFEDLSTNPGYNPAELAMLNTQSFEPIEANRAASKQRAIERSAARGFAPSSGLMELDLRDIERSADAARTVAGRDLAIAGLDRRDRDLSRALDLGQMLGLDIPRGQRGEELGLANLLYQMPRTALQDALSVISGTPNSNDAFAQAMQLLMQQYQQQGRSDANNAALYGQIGSILAGLFR